MSRTNPVDRCFVVYHSSLITDEKPISNDKMLVFVPPHPLIRHWLSVLRDKQNSSSIFRNAMAELGRLLIYEASRDWLPTVSGEFQAPNGGVASVEFIDPNKPIGIVPIMRAGLVLAEHASSILPATQTYHLGLCRDNATLLPSLYLNKLPEKFSEDSRVFVVDPMLASGRSMEISIDLIKERGVENKQIRVISAVACPEALKRLSEKFPGLHVYCGAIDGILDDKECITTHKNHQTKLTSRYILLGFGDAGDRSFNT